MLGAITKGYQNAVDTLSGYAGERNGLDPDQQRIVEQIESLVANPGQAEWNTADAVFSGGFSYGVTRQALFPDQDMQINFNRASTLASQVREIEVIAGDQVALRLRHSRFGHGSIERMMGDRPEDSPIARRLVEKVMDADGLPSHKHRVAQDMTDAVEAQTAHHNRWRQEYLESKAA